MGKRSGSRNGRTANRNDPKKTGIDVTDPWWEVLQVSALASLDEATTAFRKLAMQFHPDLWANATEDQRTAADSRMKMINAAFEKAEHEINVRQKFAAKVEQEAAISAMQKAAAKAQQKATARTKRKSAAKAKQDPVDTASQVMSNIFLSPTARKKLRITKIIYAVVISVLTVLIFALIHFQKEYSATHLEQAKKDSKETKVEVPPGSKVQISDEDHIDVTLPKNGELINRTAKSNSTSGKISGNGTWNYAPSLTLKRDMLAVAIDGDGKIFAISGAYQYPWAFSDTVETFDGKQWSTLPARLPHSPGGAATDKYGYVYSICERNVNRYNPTLGRWEPRQHMNFPRRGVSTARDAQGRIYAICGASTNKVERYDSDKDTWETLDAALSSVRWGAAAVADREGRIYAIGGYAEPSNETNNLVERFDPERSDLGWVTLAPMPTPRQSPSAVLAPDGNIWVMGGSNSNSVLNTVEIFNPSTNRWTTGPSLQKARNCMGAVVTESGTIYAIGGGKWASPVDTVESYTVESPDWPTRSAAQSKAN